MPACKYDGQKDSNGDPHGIGTAIFATGRYRGQWACGVFHGRGELLLNNGTHYVGEFQDNKFHGRGAVKWADGRVYEGDFQYGKMHGNGKVTLPQGTYVGAFLEGKRHGKGTMDYIDGSQYSGEWRHDKLCGHGKLVDKDGVMFEGKWQNGVMNGIIHMTKKSGSVYRQLYLDGRLSTSERVKAGPSFIERWLFGAAPGKGGSAGEGSPQGHASPTSSGIASPTGSASPTMGRPSTAPMNMRMAARHFDAMQGAASPGSPAGTAASAASIATPGSPAAASSGKAGGSGGGGADESAQREEAKANLGSDHDDDEDAAAGPSSPSGLRRVKSLKDMALKKPPPEVEDGEAGSPLGRKPSMNRRPNSAGVGEGLLRRASVIGTGDGEGAAARGRSRSPGAGGEHDGLGSSPPLADSADGGLESSINTTLAQLPKKGSFSQRSPQMQGGGGRHGGGGSDDDESGAESEEIDAAEHDRVMTPEQRRRVDELNRRLAVLGAAPVPPAMAELQARDARERAASGGANGDDVLSAEHRERRRMSIYESKLDTALEAGLERKASMASLARTQSTRGVPAQSGASGGVTSPPLSNGLKSPPGPTARTGDSPGSTTGSATGNELASPGSFVRNQSFTAAMLANSSFMHGSFVLQNGSMISLGTSQELLTSGSSFVGSPQLTSPSNGGGGAGAAPRVSPQRSRSFLSQSQSDDYAAASGSPPIALTSPTNGDRPRAGRRASMGPMAQPTGPANAGEAPNAGTSPLDSSLASPPSAPPAPPPLPPSESLRKRLEAELSPGSPDLDQQHDSLQSAASALRSPTNASFKGTPMQTRERRKSVRFADLSQVPDLQLPSAMRNSTQ